MKTAISTDKAPQPIASYSQAVRTGNLLFLSGQGGIDASTGELVSDDIGEQTRQTLRNLQHLLEAAGASWENVVSVRAFVTEHDEFPGFNDMYGEFFQEPFPARTTVFCDLAPGMKVEIDAIAVL